VRVVLSVCVMLVAANWLKACRLSDPELNVCVKDTFQHMFPALAAGISGMAPCSLVCIYQRSEGHMSTTRTLKMQAVLSCETMVCGYQTKRCHNTEHHNLNPQFKRTDKSSAPDPSLAPCSQVV
jgi:hypothetical protein